MQKMAHRSTNGISLKHSLALQLVQHIQYCFHDLNVVSQVSERGECIGQERKCCPPLNLPFGIKTYESTGRGRWSKNIAARHAPDILNS
jgi:hypothetical protein